jgi:hypothetical protein
MGKNVRDTESGEPRMKKIRHFAMVACFVSACLPDVGLAAQAVQNVDEPGRNPWQQTKQTQVNTGDCISGLCVIIFKQVPKGQRLVITYASASFDGSTALGTGVVDASISTTIPGVPGEVRAQIPVSTLHKNVPLFRDVGMSPSGLR